MKFENTKVMNFESAFRGMRNPLESWNKSDSFFGMVDECSEYDLEITHDYLQKKYPKIDFSNYKYELFQKDYDKIDLWLLNEGCLYKSPHGYMQVAYIGPKDMELAQKLVKAGSEHRKFMRQIFVSVDITGPLYWWKEADIYKIGTTANSTSTMHKLTSKPITLDCFEVDDYKGMELFLDDDEFSLNREVKDIINLLEKLRQKYLETKDKRYWKELIRWLPESWLQTRTITFNYEVLYNIVNQRENHKLTEWHSFIDWVKTLPYSNELIFSEIPRPYTF